MMRPKFDYYFMQMTDLVATRATCAKRKVGAVIVRENRLLATGYNGSPPGMPHCTDPGVGCLIDHGHCIRTLHAEQNAILQAAAHGVPTQGATIYLTCAPCHICARMIAGAGIKRVVYQSSNRPVEVWAVEVLEGCGVALELWEAEATA